MQNVAPRVRQAVPAMSSKPLWHIAQWLVPVLRNIKATMAGLPQEKYIYQAQLSFQVPLSFCILADSLHKWVRLHPSCTRTGHK